MAFYEMLPGAGMPPGLQAGMDSVLNKKFGTSTTYPAEDWPDTVNLMGPLPEKTASGAIVTFPDGADGVPLKKCEITLPASLDGYSEVDVIHTGKNMLDYSSMVYGYVQSNGQFATYHTQGEMRSGFIPVKPNTQYHLALETEGTAPAWVGIGHYSDANVESFIERTGYWGFTTGANTHYVVVSARNFEEATNCQLELGAVTTTFEPYSPIDTHTASLGRTIYGGTADVVAGSGTEEYSVPIALSSLTWTKENNHFYSNALTTLKGPVNNTVPANIVVSSPYTNMAYSSMIGEGTDKSISLNNSKRIYIYDSEVTDTTELETALSGKYLVGELATPETFTFTPITPTPETALGTNNFWADEGDSEVTYRADINLALGGN